MKNYMLIVLPSKEENGKIIKLPDETFAHFFDKYQDARNSAMDYECGVGWYWELYERQELKQDGINEREYVRIE